MEDDRVSILEQQLAQAKLIAEEADKKYEEVHSSAPLLNTHINHTVRGANEIRDLGARICSSSVRMHTHSRFVRGV